MPILEKGSRLIWQRSSRSEKITHWLVTTALLVVFLISWRMISAYTLWVFVLDAPEQAGRIFSRMVPPRPAYLPQLWRPLWDTVLIATFGTAGALVLAGIVAIALRSVGFIGRSRRSGLPELTPCRSSASPCSPRSCRHSPEFPCTAGT